MKFDRSMAEREIQSPPVPIPMPLCPPGLLAESPPHGCCQRPAVIRSFESAILLKRPQLNSHVNESKAQRRCRDGSSLSSASRWQMPVLLQNNSATQLHLVSELRVWITSSLHGTALPRSLLRAPLLPQLPADQPAAPSAHQRSPPAPLPASSSLLPSPSARLPAAWLLHPPLRRQCRNPQPPPPPPLKLLHRPLPCRWHLPLASLPAALCGLQRRVQPYAPPQGPLLRPVSFQKIACWRCKGQLLLMLRVAASSAALRTLLQRLRRDLSIVRKLHVGNARAKFLLVG